jgi:hypothetical protein
MLFLFAKVDEQSPTLRWEGLKVVVDKLDCQLLRRSVNAGYVIVLVIAHTAWYRASPLLV